MKHPAIREVFRHWDERRAGRLAPERSDIEPSAIRGVLADTFIIGFDPTMGHPFRVAGTRVCALFGREIKGEGFLDLFWHGARDEMRDLIAIVTHDSIGVAASASELAASGRGPALELLVLPLRCHGRTDARLLGALIPSGPADWLGRRVLSDLVPGYYRFLRNNPAQLPALQVNHQLNEGRIRHGLVVFDGGQPCNI